MASSRQILLKAVTADGAGSVFKRDEAASPVGRIVWNKTNTGTCTLEIKEALTGAVLVSENIGATNPVVDSAELLLPLSFYAQISNDSGTFAITVYVEQ